MALPLQQPQLIEVTHGVILDVGPTPAHRTAEVESTKTMVNRIKPHGPIWALTGSSSQKLRDSPYFPAEISRPPAFSG